MEIIQNKYGNDRVIEKIATDKIRIMGDSIVFRKSENEHGHITMFDFEGGPCLNIGGKIRFAKSDWTIKKIIQEDTGKENLYSVTLEVKL